MLETSSPLQQTGELVQRPYFAFMRQAIGFLQGRERHVLKLEPVFYAEFSCSGCGLCCQRPWNISVSQDYVQCWSDEFARHPSGLYHDAFIPRSPASKERFADIQRKPNSNECVFLTDDKRCFIQETYGEEALSQVCRQYPRYEGWFNAFLAQFMMQSCPDVVELNQKIPGIRYQVLVVKPEQWEQLKPLHHPMGYLQGLLWLGLQLDLFERPDYTPIQILRGLAGGLKSLPVTLSSVQTQDQERLLRQFSVPPAADLANLAEAWECLTWFLQPLSAVTDYLIEVRQGIRDWPQLINEERHVLNQFLRRYLAYRALTASYIYPAGHSFLFQHYFQLAIHVAMLQWIALSYREREGGRLNQSQLVRAATLIGYRYEQANQYVEMLAKQSRTVCLTGMQSILSFDFGSES